MLNMIFELSNKSQIGPYDIFDKNTSFEYDDLKFRFRKRKIKNKNQKKFFKKLKTKKK